MIALYKITEIILDNHLGPKYLKIKEFTCIPPAPGGPIIKYHSLI